MGLFDFLSKKSDKVKSSGFVGDLSFVDNNPPRHIPYDGAIGASFGTDSKDSVVFMTFDATPQMGWTCHECGTDNSARCNVCVVCGLRK